jgi:hypothetical protein
MVKMPTPLFRYHKNLNANPRICAAPLVIASPGGSGFYCQVDRQPIIIAKNAESKTRVNLRIAMFVLPPIAERSRNVCLLPKADIGPAVLCGETELIFRLHRPAIKAA